MPEKQKQIYGNESITSLKGADRVRLRPSVIFGSDGLDGCVHSFFEILANSIDEAREGFGSLIRVTRHADYSITVEDQGRGIPLDFNPNEQRYNWELVYCELYAGGKYMNNSGENYEFALGLNGLGACATQYSSEYMDVTVFRDGYKYELHFEKGNNIGGLKKEKCGYEHTGTIRNGSGRSSPISGYPRAFRDILKRQAVVNAGLVFELIDEGGTTERFWYENGIIDYVNELGQKEPDFGAVFRRLRAGRDRRTSLNTG